MQGIGQPMRAIAENRFCAAALGGALLPEILQSSRSLSTLRLQNSRRLTPPSLATRKFRFFPGGMTAALDTASLRKFCRSSCTFCTLRSPNFARLALSSLATHKNGFGMSGAAVFATHQTEVGPVLPRRSQLFAAGVTHRTPSFRRRPESSCAMPIHCCFTFAS